MSERWTLLIDDEGPTRVDSDEADDRTLPVGDVAPASRQRMWSSRSGPRYISTKQGTLLLGVLGGMAVGFLLGLGFPTPGSGDTVRRRVHQVQCADSDSSADRVLPAIGESASKLATVARSEPSLDDGPMVRRAADLLVANRYAEALVSYRRLVELHPAEVVFQHVSSVLEAKLRCDSSRSRGGGACE